jgi:hypothetical protein
LHLIFLNQDLQATLAMASISCPEVGLSIALVLAVVCSNPVALGLMNRFEPLLISKQVEHDRPALESSQI